MTAKILTCKQDNGLRHSSFLDPANYPLKEPSGSGFQTYGLTLGGVPVCSSTPTLNQRCTERGQR